MLKLCHLVYKINKMISLDLNNNTRELLLVNKQYLLVLSLLRFSGSPFEVLKNF